MSKKPTHSILIIDDDDYVLKSLSRVLRRSDYAISCYHDPEEALMQCGLKEYDLVLSDQRMPGMLGTQFFEQLMQFYPTTRRVLISGYTDFSSVTDAFNEGIIHKFMLKPWDNEGLRMLIADELRQRENIGSAPDSSKSPKSKKTADVRQAVCSASDSYHGILTSDEAMLQQLSIIQRTANTEAPFFINGETGTGKEMIAKAIHLESDRADKPFIALNCANLSETLLESQLFGHIKGAFTGADKDQEGLFSAADGGTLFLDEVVEIPPALQAKLLRVLQEREFTPLGTTKPQSFDVKIISAAAQSLESAVSEGCFREDLRYRLEVMPVHLPPLRARKLDIKILFDHYLQLQFLRHGYELTHVDEAVYACIDAYPWPGNIRELVNVCTYIAALSGPEGKVSKSSLPPVLHHSINIQNPVQQTAKQALPNGQRPLKLTKENLRQAISEHNGHRESIANAFGMSRMTVWRKMKEFDLID